MAIWAGDGVLSAMVKDLAGLLVTSSSSSLSAAYQIFIIYSDFKCSIEVSQVRDGQGGVTKLVGDLYSQWAL